MKVTGIILIVVGILMMVITGFNFKTKEKVVDLGPVEINKEKDHSVGWPMYVGGIVLVAGIGLAIAGRKS